MIKGTINGIYFEVDLIDDEMIITTRPFNYELVIKSLNRRIYNPQTGRIYTAHFTDSILEAYLILEELKTDKGINVDLLEIPPNLIEQPIDDGRVY